jgi:hypothetical protein
MGLDEAVEKELPHIHDTIMYVRKMSTSKSYKAYTSGLLKVLDGLLDGEKDSRLEEIALKDETAARALSDKVWEQAAELIAKHYLRWSKEKIKEMKEGKDADGGGSYEETIARALGVDKEGMYESFFKGRTKLSSEELKGIHGELVKAHLSAKTGKYLANNIKTAQQAKAVSHYFREAASQYKDEFDGIRIEDLVDPDKARKAIMSYAGRIASNYAPAYAKK